MALGLSPEYTQTLGFGDLSKQQVLLLAISTAKQLGWAVGGISKTGFFAIVPASIDSPGEEFRMLIWDGLATIKSESPGSQLVDWGKNKENMHAFIAQFEIIENSAGPEMQGQPVEDLHLAGGTDAVKQLFLRKNRLSDVLAIFRPVKGYFITPIIVDINILVFIAMIISGAGFWSADTQKLVSWGADYRPLTINGEWWRLITSTFLHGGFMHLFSNMLVLVYLGLLAEPHLGKMRFAVAYFLTGIAASIASTLSYNNVVSAGASGAIFGLCGVLLALLTTNFLERSASKKTLIGLSIFVAYNLIRGWNDSHIDYAAHIGGFVCGLLIGYAYYPSLKKPGAARLANQAVTGVSIVILAFCWFIFQSIPNDLNKYHNKMNLFATMKMLALKADHLPQNTPKDSLLATLRNPGIYYWGECIKLLDSLDQLNLPNNIHERNHLLKRYCIVNISSYKLRFKEIYDNTDMFKDSETYYNQNIKAIADSLSKK